MKKQLDQKWYNMLKELDFSEIQSEITFDDKNQTFETESELFDIIFNENIVSRGMDKNHDQCTEHGRELYMLYDLIFSS